LPKSLYFSAFFFSRTGAKVERAAVELGEVTPNNLGQLKRLHSVIFPVTYADKFFKSMLDTPDFVRLGTVCVPRPPKGVHLARLTLPHLPCLSWRDPIAYYNDCAVGEVCAKREPFSGDPKEKDSKVYIMTLGVLAPYRQLGVGSELLSHVIELCHKDATVKQLYVHMQVGNEEGLKFYQSKGFTITETVTSYYKNIEPADAHILARTFHKSS